MEKVTGHLMKETYGVTYNFTPEVVMLYGQILMMVVGGDGEVSEAEMEYMAARSGALGVPQPMIDVWAAYDYKNGDLAGSAATLFEMIGAQAYAFIYDAVKVSRVDGYHEDERRALRTAAKAANVPEHVVTSIENLVEAEEALRDLRISLLYPQKSVFHS